MMSALIAGVAVTIGALAQSGPAPYASRVAWDLSTNGCPPQDAANRAAELIRSADEGGDPAVGAQRRIAAANWILARGIEPAVSRFFLDIPAPGDREQILTAVRRAAGQLDLARTPRSDEPATTQPASRPASAPAVFGLEAVDAFAQAITAVFDAGDSEADTVRRQKAAGRMALLLEDNRPGVNSAAALWQAALLRRIGRPDRAIEVTPRPLAARPPGEPRFDFYARLLRCRCIAERGGYAAASALLLQLEKRCADLFALERDRTEAGRAASLVRQTILSRWADAADPQTGAAERDWCRAAVERIRKTVCGESDRCFVLRLGYAIPILVEIPGEPPPEKPSATTSAPPESPDSETEMPEPDESPEEQ